MSDRKVDSAPTLPSSTPKGAKTPHRGQRPEYVARPDKSRDPPEDSELDSFNVLPDPWSGRRKNPERRAGAKIWRKAREGKL